MGGLRHPHCSRSLDKEESTLFAGNNRQWDHDDRDTVSLLCFGDGETRSLHGFDPRLLDSVSIIDSGRWNNLDRTAQVDPSLLFYSISAMSSGSPIVADSFDPLGTF